MASRPKDNSRKGDAAKSSARKTPETKKSVSKATSSDVKGRANAEGKSAREKKSTRSKGGAQKKSSKGFKAFREYLGGRACRGLSVLSRDRTIIDHLVFAIFLENGSFEQARYAFLEIMHNFVDWNEVRVSKANEIAAVIGDIPCAVVAGERLRRLLQWIFDKTYDFDLEGLRQKGETELLDFVSGIPYSTRFMNDYVKLFAFGGVNLPLSEGALRVLRLLGFVRVVGDEEFLDDGGDVLNETETVNFFIQLHELGVELMDDAKADDVLKFLKGFDKNSAKRSFEPLVAPKNCDPVDIARQLARKQKDDVRKDAPSQMYDASSDSDLDEDSDDFEMDSDSVDDNQGVSETDLSGGETSYRASEKRTGSSSSSRLARSKSGSEPFKVGTVEKDLFVVQAELGDSSGSSRSSKKTKGTSESEADNKPQKKSGKGRSAEIAVTDSTSRTVMTGKQKKSKEEKTPKSSSKRLSQGLPEKPSGASKRRASADTSNVATSEPPDLHSKGGEQGGRTASSSPKSTAGKESGVTSGKRARGAKSKDSAQKASKLKEIQQKKPR